MCDWPVWDGYYRFAGEVRQCGNNGYRFGEVNLCGRHEKKVVDGLFSELREGHPSLWADVMNEIEQALRRDPRGEVWSRLASLVERHRMALQPRKEDDPLSYEARGSVVYFAEREGFVKIGTTLNVAQRMRALAAGGNMPDGMTVGPLTLLATIPGDRVNERFFHRKFAHLRLDAKREWFLLEAELREFIAGLKGSVLAGAL